MSGWQQNYRFVVEDRAYVAGVIGRIFDDVRSFLGIQVLADFNGPEQESAGLVVQEFPLGASAT